MKLPDESFGMARLHAPACRVAPAAGCHEKALSLGRKMPQAPCPGRRRCQSVCCW